MIIRNFIIKFGLDLPKMYPNENTNDQIFYIWKDDAFAII